MKRFSGISLLELTLVLVIGTSIMLLGVRFYQQFQFQANEKKMMGNVNTLFQAMNGFYYANCRRALDSSANPQSPGSLDPLVTDSSGTKMSIKVNVMTDLVTPGFITNWQPNNPLLDNSPTPDSGYYIQFNRVVVAGADAPMNVYACSGTQQYPSCDVTQGQALSSTLPPAQQTKSVKWVVQVAVKLATNLTTAQWTQIMNDLSADCVSSLNGQSINACVPLPAADGYLVWTRTPSAYNPDITSDYWTSMPYATTFKMQYTNDGMGALTGVTNETQNTSTANTWYNALNYLCGG